MDQKEFERLARTCDIVLERSASDHVITAISWLHVLNVHPNSTQQYQYGLNKRSFFSAIRLTLYHIAYIGYKLFKSITEQRIDVKELPGRADALFISHLVGASMPKDNLDFYYGGLPYHAETERGLVSVIGMIDHTPGSKKKSQLSSIIKSNPAKYIFPKTHGFRKEITLIGQCFSSFRTLMRMSNIERDHDIKIVLREAALQSISPDTFYTLRISESVKDLIAYLKPANLIITWEGRAWERLAIYAARNSGLSIKCIGYQHTILLSSSHSIKRSLGRTYDPDIIFTLGEVTTNILRPELKQSSVYNYGSYRLTLSGGDHFKKLDEIVCLVTPEGLDGESLFLFDLAVEAAKKMPHVKFIFRMHPVFPFSMFTANHPDFLTLPANCMVSDLPSVNDDLKRCNFLLYRASSVALYAVIAGLKPVYYNVPGEMAIDSLFLMNNWRSSVQNSDEFATVVDNYQQMDDDTKEEQYLPALAFCRQYVGIPDEAVFLNSLSLKN